MSIDSGELIHNVFSLSNIRHICLKALYKGFEGLLGWVCLVFFFEALMFK